MTELGRNHRLRGLGKPTLFLAVFLLLGAACQAGGAGEPEAQSTPAPTDTLSTEIVPEGGESFDAELEVGPGDFFLADPRMGLDGLSSYTATLVVTFDGSGAGKPSQGTSTTTLWFSRDPLAYQLRIENTGEAGAADPTFLAQQGEVAYEIGADGSCKAAPIDEDAEDPPLDVLEPAGLLKAVYGAEGVGQVTINDVNADHYVFDQRALIQAGIANASGEAWVASDNGVLLKYVLSATAGPEYLGEGVEGTMTWDYSLTDADRTEQPPLPEGCQLEAPLMADASDILHLPRWLAYTTSATFSEVAAFYQAQLPGGGWTLVSEPMASEASSFMEFARGDETIGVFATLKGGVTQVDIVLYNSQD